MFVDDLKIYASGAKALGQSLKVVERITTAIGMRIGAQKCATACLRKGKRTEASDYSITEDVIKELIEGQTYKYLGIHQTIRSDPEKVRRALGEVYKRRLHQIWKAQMSGRNKIHATNIWAVSLFRYYFSSPLKWTKISLRDLDRATRAILRKHRGHYRGASVERLCLKSRSGGRGLQSLSQTYQREIIAAVAYLVGSADPIHQSIVEHQQWMKGMHHHSLLAEAEKAVQELEMGASLEREQIQEVGAKKLAKVASQAQQQQLMDALQAKTIHGVFMKTSRNPTREFELTPLWLRWGKQRAETEALVQHRMESS